MKPVEFKEQNLVIAKNQPEYRSLPVHFTGDDGGKVISCWRLSIRERIKLAFTGCIWVSILTFGRSMQPLMAEVDKPVMKP